MHNLKGISVRRCSIKFNQKSTILFIIVKYKVYDWRRVRVWFHNSYMKKRDWILARLDSNMKRTEKRCTKSIQMEYANIGSESIRIDRIDRFNGFKPNYYAVDVLVTCLRVYLYDVIHELVMKTVVVCSTARKVVLCEMNKIKSILIVYIELVTSAHKVVLNDYLWFSWWIQKTKLLCECFKQIERFSRLKSLPLAVYRNGSIMMWWWNEIVCPPLYT